MLLVIESADDNAYTENITDPAFGFLIWWETGRMNRFSKKWKPETRSCCRLLISKFRKVPHIISLDEGLDRQRRPVLQVLPISLDKLYPNWKVGPYLHVFFIAETGMLGMLINVIFVISLFFWRPPGVRREPSRFTITRQVFIILTIIYLFYENMYMLPVGP
ncbi:MAG: hypothetical protein R3B93_13730 [Bacteroidia bacterium]